MGTLFLVATPIGNLGDITTRAVETLRQVSLVAAEDTRHSGRLLDRLEIEARLISLHAHNEQARVDRILAELQTGDVALISDAGSPGISDPGFRLVNAAIEAGFQVSPVPGPSSVIAAVTASGLAPGPFLTLGFLPRKGKERAEALTRAGRSGYPVVIFESPERLVATLGDLAAAWGDRRCVVARELTKRFEEFIRGTLTSVAQRLQEGAVRGECVLVVGGAERDDQASLDPKDIALDLLTGGQSLSEIARQVANLTGMPRSEAYALTRSLRDEQDRA